MKDFSKIIAEFCEFHPEAPSIEVARKIIAEVPQEQFATMLAWEIDTFRRNQVRGMEKTAFKAFFDNERSDDPMSIETITNLRKVFSEKFALGKNREVVWGKATIADHRARIEYLKALRGGIDKTIERHEEAIRLIEAHNATCLDEIEIAA